MNLEAFKLVFTTTFRYAKDVDMNDSFFCACKEMVPKDGDS